VLKVSAYIVDISVDSQGHIGRSDAALFCLSPVRLFAVVWVGAHPVPTRTPWLC
jgi:hypothetical protein